MQHQPDRARRVQAELQEVVARAERAQLRHRPLAPPVHLRRDLVEPRPEVVPARHRVAVQLGRVDRLGVRGAADRDRLLDPVTQPGQVVRQVAGRERGPDRAHPAADVDADGGRADRAPHRDHGADGGALAQVHVGHHGEAGDPGQRGDVAQLPHGLALDGGRVGPHPDGHPDAGNFGVRHGETTSEVGVSRSWSRTGNRLRRGGAPRVSGRVVQRESGSAGEWFSGRVVQRERRAVEGRRLGEVRTQ